MGRRYLKPGLTEPYLKTIRAKTHLDALRDGLKAFRESEPITFFRKENHRSGRYEIRVKVSDTPNDIPLILGDLLYCLRSSLDQTVWQLGKLRSGYPEGTQFRILEKNNRDARKSFDRWTSGIPARAEAVMKQLQPYHRVDPADHLLASLNRLCNIDKHRRIPIRGDELAFNFPALPRSESHLLNLDHEHAMISVPLSLKSKMALDPTVGFDVVFGDMADGVECKFERIESIYDFVVNKVIPGFARFFP